MVYFFLRLKLNTILEFFFIQHFLFLYFLSFKRFSSNWVAISSNLILAIIGHWESIFSAILSNFTLKVMGLKIISFPINSQKKVNENVLYCFYPFFAI